MGVLDPSILQHAALVLVVLGILDYLGRCHSFAFFIAFLYLCKVNARYSIRERRKMQYQEKKHANQQRLLSNAESLRWLNHALEKVWPICVEQVASQQFLLPIIPWFLDKFKPWTVKKAIVEHLYLGRCPPMFTNIRVLGEPVNEDHMILELGMNFLSADDMRAVLAVKLRKRLGFGVWAKMHVTRMHIEGKVLVTVKFIEHWPFLGRVRVCFIGPPYLQMTVKPMFHHGIDVTDLPGIASWLDKIIQAAFEQTLVEPNMLVVDIEKFASAARENWFTVDVKSPVAFAQVEIVEAKELQPSDSNDLANLYVRGHLGPYRFQTKIQEKTVSPKWHEVFKIPITSWEACNNLVIEVLNNDPISDGKLGNCSINIADLRDGERHDKWLLLPNFKPGRLLLAITIVKVELEKHSNMPSEEEEEEVSEITSEMSSPMTQEDSYRIDSSETYQKLSNDEHRPCLEPWLHELEYFANPNLVASCKSSSNKDTTDVQKVPHETIRRGLQKVSLVLHHKAIHTETTDEESSRAEKHNSKSPTKTHIKEKAKDMMKHKAIHTETTDEESSRDEKHNSKSPTKTHIKEKAKDMMKHAGKSAHNLKTAIKTKVHEKWREDHASESKEPCVSEN
ncbi:hypothetical protein HPP92_021477 [Vanilla planifolia]|uniref:C2 domain-containing protein n=1 Tax=Vanilla planifolia TaxID=51239 RepID=A0A835PVM8_VANPL|nr:hypothetical protein HPP92_021477 [Vanilla planifolia]